MQKRMMIKNLFLMSSLCFAEVLLSVKGILNFLRIQFIIFSLGMKSPLAIYAMKFNTISTFGGIINVQLGT